MLRTDGFREWILCEPVGERSVAPLSNGCPNKPYKIEPGVCGCLVPDTDSDGDSVPDGVGQVLSDPDRDQEVARRGIPAAFRLVPVEAPQPDVFPTAMLDTKDHRSVSESFSPPLLHALRPSGGISNA